MNTRQSPFQVLGSIVGVKGSVNAPLYATVGYSLMVFKYIVEAVTVFVVSGQFFSPQAFLIPSFMLREEILSAGPAWLPWAMVIWSLPFVWIACTMSARRAIDISGSPWMGIMVLVPIVNLPFMVVMSLLPSANSRFNNTPYENLQPAKRSTQFDLPDNSPTQTNSLASIYSAMLGVFIGGVYAIGATALSTYAMHDYGNSLFIGMPIVSGAVSGYIFNQPGMRGFWPSVGVGVLSVVIGGMGLLLFAVEGVICLVMAMPLILPLGALGGALGWGLAKTILIQSKLMLGGALLLVPFFASVEHHFKSYRELKVESSVIVAAPPEDVWRNVIAFPDIKSPPAWYFNMGVASPLRARIIGSGVGAVRHCEFTTGSFVEPITVWDQPRRLAFDVTEQPDPLIELTPYRDVRPPHLQHSFRSVKGEFELIALPDGQTKLIGRTWYTLEMGPSIYWKVWTDEIIHRIHLRVLTHICENTEADK